MVVEDRQAVKTSRAIMIGTVDDFAVEKFTSDPRTSPGTRPRRLGRHACRSPEPWCKR